MREKIGNSASRDGRSDVVCILENPGSAESRRLSETAVPTPFQKETEVMDWNYRMADAPRGTVVEGDRVQIGDTSRSNRKFVPTRILISFLDNGVSKVSQTYRTEPSIEHPTGYWAGLHPKNQGYAWMPYPEPAEPPR
jgi:hypothetical protein